MAARTGSGSVGHASIRRTRSGSVCQSVENAPDFAAPFWGQRLKLLWEVDVAENGLNPLAPNDLRQIPEGAVLFLAVS